MGTKILIADDESDIVSMLGSFFESKGFRVLPAFNGAEALKQVEKQPDIILLDINMPGTDGLEVCKRIRDHISCPILFLTARIEDTDKVKGFTVGGDDYIVKPFSLMELEARVRAHLRREARHNFEAQVKFSGDLTIDYSERCLFFGDKRVGLAKKEFDIVELLSQNPGQIFDKERIYERTLHENTWRVFFCSLWRKGLFMELKTIGLTKKFGSKTAVDNLNITLTNGVYGLLGANGAGKTTLMRLLCNIQNPTSGKILLNGKNIVGLGERYRNLLGYLPQHFGYYPDFSAFDFLLYVSALKGLDEKAARKKSKELLEAVDLSRESKHKIKTFSGGMKQRLGIAQAMLNDPHILILDEPTAGLDPKERVRFRNLISAFSKDRIVILSTHIVSDVEFIAEEIIMMKSGQIIHFGNPQEITSEIDGQVWECTVPTAYAEKYAAAYNTSNLRNTSENQTILRIIGDRPPMENAVRVQPTLEDLYLFYFKGGCEE